MQFSIFAELPYDLAIPLQDTYPKVMKSSCKSHLRKYLYCTLLYLAKIHLQPRYSLAEKWIKKRCWTYIMGYHSVFKNLWCKGKIYATRKIFMSQIYHLKHPMFSFIFRKYFKKLAEYRKGTTRDWEEYWGGAEKCIDCFTVRSEVLRINIENKMWFMVP